MSIIVLATKKFGISYREHHWLVRASKNTSLIALCFVITRQYAQKNFKAGLLTVCSASLLFTSLQILADNY